MTILSTTLFLKKNKYFLTLYVINLKDFFYKLDRMSDGTIAVWIHEGFVGKIRLCKKKHWMMISKKKLYEHEIIEGSLDDFIQGIDLWINYIKKHLL